MMKMIFIRHGKVKSNLEARYCGCRTDQPVCTEGLAELKDRSVLLRAEAIYSSPMKRAMQTAKISMPGVPITVVPAFREMDFGVFEGRTAEEMEFFDPYNDWVDSGCKTKCPGGESMAEFSLRVNTAFTDIVKKADEQGVERIAIVAHGGTSLALISEFTNLRCGFFGFMPKHGHGFTADIDMSGEKLRLTEFKEY